MNPPPKPRQSGRTGFRAKLLVAMMVLVSALTTLGLYLAQRDLTAEVTRDLQRQFRDELGSLHRVQDLRHAALAERCRTLARKPRIHAALEDDALDLLYPTAKDELHDFMDQGRSDPERTSHVLRAEFYRFLNLEGGVISPSNPVDVGELSREEESQLSLRPLPREQQLAYVAGAGRSSGETVFEVITMPIVSTETGEPIAALALGFKPAELGGMSANHGMRSGIWVRGRLHFPALTEPALKTLGDDVARAIKSRDRRERSYAVDLAGVPHLLFYTRLNPESLYAPAFEVCVFPLTDLLARRRQLRWQILGAGALILLVGFAGSHYLSARLSVPVERLAEDSDLNRAQRERAETALEQTHVELRRSVRFSADTSHQLKTPVTVLRAGLEELLAREDLAPEVRDELAELVHQTYRLTGVIEDLLLLSRMDAGRLQLALAPVNLSQLLEAELDDLSAQPNPLELTIEPDFPAGLHVVGEKRYTTMIVRNLLENARKYNLAQGRIWVRVREEGERVLLAIGNTGRPIPPASREHVFERFHRGSAGENIPGHGLGLNISRELARLHGGDLHLARSDETGTEFEVRFCRVNPAPVPEHDPA